MDTPVIKVEPWGEGQGDFVEINESDFDPKIHKKYNPKPAKKTTKKTSKKK